MAPRWKGVKCAIRFRATFMEPFMDVFMTPLGAMAARAAGGPMGECPAAPATLQEQDVLRARVLRGRDRACAEASATRVRLMDRVGPLPFKTHADD